MASQKSDGSAALTAWSKANGGARVASAALGMTYRSFLNVCSGHNVPGRRARERIAAITGVGVDSWPDLKKRGGVCGGGRKAVESTDLVFADSPSPADVASRVGEDVRRVVYFPDYYITESGRLFRWTPTFGLRQPKLWNNPKLRHTAVLQAHRPDFKAQKGVRVSRLVCLHFNGSPPDDTRTNVLHRDDNPANNHFTNLRWGTQAENVEDARRNERLPRGLSNARAARAIELAAGGMTVNQLASRFGVGSTTIENLLNGRSFVHLPGVRVLRRRTPNYRRIIEMARGGTAARDIAAELGITPQRVFEMISRARKAGLLPPSGFAVMSPTHVRQVRALRAAGHTYKQIANALGFSSGAVLSVALGRTHADVADAPVRLPRMSAPPSEHHNARKPQSRGQHRCRSCGGLGHNVRTCASRKKAA